MNMPMVSGRTRRSVEAVCAGLFLVCLPQLRATAQGAGAGCGTKEGFDDRGGADPLCTRLDTLADMHKLHVEPHTLIFDEKTQTATITFSNKGKKPILGMVLVVFAYPDWPHGPPADTTIITPYMNILLPRDSVILNPSPKEPFIGPWLSGLPTTLTLAPHTTQKVTVRLTPPANLPTGEYWARVIAMVRPQDQHRATGAQDVRQHYAMPIKGGIQPLRDSVVIYYRKGALHSAIAIAPEGGPHGTAVRYDSTNPGLGGPDGRDCPKSLWIRLPLHVTGNAHVEGTLTVTYKNVQTGGLVPVNKYPLAMFRDGVTHWWTHTCWVKEGRYQAIIRIEPTDPRLPFKPVEYTVPKPFDIP